VSVGVFLRGAGVEDYYIRLLDYLLEICGVHRTEVLSVAVGESTDN
jgi:hypothetical protein